MGSGTKFFLNYGYMFGVLQIVERERERLVKAYDIYGLRKNMAINMLYGGTQKVNCRWDKFLMRMMVM